MTFIHGIGNKPNAEDLHRDWRVVLFDDDGLDLDALGVTSSMVYWADMLYESPVPADTGQESSQLELERIVESEAADMTWLADIPDDERDFVERLAREVGLAEVTPTTDEVAPDPIIAGSPLELIPLPAGSSGGSCGCCFGTYTTSSMTLRSVPGRVRTFTFEPTSALGRWMRWRTARPGQVPSRGRAQPRQRHRVRRSHRDR